MDARLNLKCMLSFTSGTQLQSPCAWYQDLKIYHTGRTVCAFTGRHDVLLEGSPKCIAVQSQLRQVSCLVWTASLL